MTSHNPLIELIHQSPIYGVFIETGCGMPVSTALLNQSGASKTVYMTESPYSEDYAKNKYQIPNETRAVSLEYVNHILTSYQTINAINTIYVASFQVGSDAVDDNKITHGWIAIKYQQHTQFYHLTIRPKMTRFNYIQTIGQQGLLLLSYLTGLQPDTFCRGHRNIAYVDQIYTLNNVSLYPLSDFNPSLKLLDEDTILCFQPNGDLTRLENLCRETQQLIIYKGSFNPPTKAHMDLLTQTQTQYPQANKALMISINTVDKNQVNLEELKQRVEWITQGLGLWCLINTHGRFNSVIDFFQSNFPKLEIIFPVGADTYDRLESSLFDIKNVTFLNFPRTEISSTRLRQAIKDNNWEQIKELTPPEIYAILKYNQLNNKNI